MEQFSLKKYLENPSRKVVTRRGNPVRIICTDRKHGEDELPVVFLEECLNGEFLLTCRKDGRNDNYDTPYNLFFADEEEELTEFESDLFTAFRDAWQQCLRGESVNVAEWAKENSKDLLESARKELLKDLPKWKNINQVQAENHYAHIYNGIISPSGYFISYDDLETLPKEE